MERDTQKPIINELGKWMMGKIEPGKVIAVQEAMDRFLDEDINGINKRPLRVALTGVANDRPDIYLHLIWPEPIDLSVPADDSDELLLISNSVTEKLGNPFWPNPCIHMFTLDPNYEAIHKPAGLVIQEFAEGTPGASFIGIYSAPEIIPTEVN